MCKLITILKFKIKQDFASVLIPILKNKGVDGKGRNGGGEGENLMICKNRGDFMLMIQRDVANEREQEKQILREISK